MSAVSVGLSGTPMLDLPYIEDSQTMTDMNVAMTGSAPSSIQGCKHRPFNRAELGTPAWPKRATRNEAAQRAALSLD